MKKNHLATGKSMPIINFYDKISHSFRLRTGYNRLKYHLHRKWKLVHRASVYGTSGVARAFTSAGEGGKWGWGSDPEFVVYLSQWCPYLTKGKYKLPKEEKEKQFLSGVNRPSLLRHCVTLASNQSVFCCSPPRPIAMDANKYGVNTLPPNRNCRDTKTNWWFYWSR